MTRDPAATARSAFFAALPMLLMIAGVKLVWSDIPVEIYLVGVIHGLLVAMIALGFVIVYRANRIVNFAAAEMGSAPAALAFLMWGSLHWNLYLSAFLGLGVAIILGVVVEFAFLRAFFNAPRLIPTVATIGVTDLLLFVAIWLPTRFAIPKSDKYPPFINASFRVGHVTSPFDGNDIIVLIVVPLILVALALFFRYHSVGVALRATAENADRASLLGIPVRRLQSVVWALVGGLAYVAMFLRIGIVGQQLGRVLDPAVLLTALGAAVIGRMERMPTVVMAAIGLGIIDQAAVFHSGEPLVVSVAIRAAIIAIALLLQRTDTLTRLASSGAATWTATREIKRVPAELRGERAVRGAYAAAGALLLGLLVLIPTLMPEDKVKLAGAIGIYAMIGLSLVVLTGWAGQLSLGQMGFVGIAGAVAGTLANRYHWDIGLILLAAGVTGAVATMVVGVFTLRSRGLTFAVVTLAFSLAASNYFLNVGHSPIKSWVPAGSVERTHVLGLFSVKGETAFYVLIVAVLGISILMMRSLRASRIGRVLIGVRDNERVAQAYSVGARGTLMVAYGVSGFVAGMAGALFVLQQRALDAGNFDPGPGLGVFAMAVVGGLGSIGGSILGAVFFKGMQYFLTQPQWSFLSTGIGLLLVLLILPGGLGAAVGDARDGALRWYARRRGIRVPSLVADTRVDKKIAANDVDLTEALIDAAAHAESLTPVHE